MEAPDHIFKQYSHEEWIGLIKKSLKDVDFKDVKWDILPGIEGLPFATKRPGQQELNYSAGKGRNQWNTGIIVSDVKSLFSINTDGVESVLIENNPADFNVNELIAVMTAHSNFKWYCAMTGAQAVSLVNAFAANSISPLLQVKGSFVFSGLPDFSYKETKQFIERVAPGFNIIFKIPYPEDNSQKPDLIAAFISGLCNWMEEENLNNAEVQWIFDRTGLLLPVGNQFLFEIALLRSVGIIWNNLQKSYLISATDLETIALVESSKTTDSSNNQLIMNTIGVVSAALGGSRSIFIHPGHSSSEINDMTQLGKNIQLICKHESQMDFVKKAISGSYALDDLTARITNYIWDKL